MEKREIRQQVRGRIALLTAGERGQKALSLAHRVMAEPAWQGARTVLLYAALADEIDLGPLLQAALAEGKRVALPVVLPAGEMELREYRPEATARRGVYHIEEPDASCRLVAPEEVELALVPGRAFTADGLRLGRGKG